MSITGGLFAGVSGLNANGAALGVIGNNIANVNTVGFKKSSVSFADILSSSGGSAGQIGRGVFLNDVSTDFGQGSFENTSNVLDLGIEGNGFFTVSSNNGTFYTRAGRFQVNRDGNIETPDNMTLQGDLADITGTLTGVPGDINISSATSSPSTTANISISANVDSRSTIPLAFDVTDPSNTSNFSTTINVYDALGTAHPVAVYFRKDTESVALGNDWEWFAVTDGSDSANGALDEVQASGTLTFNSSGALANEVVNAPPTGGFDFSGGAALNQTISFDFGTSITEGGVGLDQSTQFGTTSSITFQSQDGFSSGSLQSISINQDGIVSGLFTNGQTRVIAQVVLTKFDSPTGLAKLGSNLYAESFDSGQPTSSPANTSGMGSIVSNTLELSNVDLAAEFITLITAQRGFQANSRIITTTDEMMAEVVNLKR